MAESASKARKPGKFKHEMPSPSSFLGQERLQGAASSGLSSQVGLTGSNNTQTVGAAGNRLRDPRSVKQQPSKSNNVLLEDVIKAVRSIDSDVSENLIKSCYEQMKHQGENITSRGVYERCIAYSERPNNHQQYSSYTNRHRSPASYHQPSSQLRSNSHEDLSVDEVSDETDSPTPFEGSSSSGDDGGDRVDGATASRCVSSNASDRHSRSHHSSNSIFSVPEAGSSSLSTSESASRRKASTAKGSPQNLDRPIPATLSTSQPISDRKSSKSDIATKAALVGNFNMTSSKSLITNSDDISTDCEGEDVLGGLQLGDEAHVDQKFEDSLKLTGSNELEDSNMSVKRNPVVDKVSPEVLRTHQLLELVKKEHELLEIQRQCIECRTKPRDITFLPCGHFTVCSTCSEPRFVCQLCNRAILGTVTTYLS